MIWQKNEQGTGCETREAASDQLPTDHTNTSHQSNINNKTSAPRTPISSHSHTTLRTRLNIPRARNAQHIPLCSLRPAGFARRLLPFRPTRRAHGAGRHPRTVPRGHDGVPSTRHGLLREFDQKCLKRRRMRCRRLHVYSTDPKRPQGDPRATN